VIPDTPLRKPKACKDFLAGFFHRYNIGTTIFIYRLYGNDNTGNNFWLPYGISQKSYSRIGAKLKYDIVASKFMTCIHNHHKRNTPVSLNNDLRLLGAVLKGLVALVVMLTAGMWCAFKALE